MEKIDKFLNLYSDIGKDKLLGKDVSSKITELKELVKELGNLQMLSISDFDFESNEKFLKSVNRFAEKLFKDAE